MTKSATAAEKATSDTEIDLAVNQIDIAAAGSVAGSITNSAAKSSAATWVASHAKIDVFGSGSVWVPEMRATSVQNKGVKALLLQIWTSIAALDTAGLVSMAVKSDTISAAFLDSPFIFSYAWDKVSVPFAKSALDIIYNNVIWTSSEKKALMKHPLQTKMRPAMTVMLHKILSDINNRSAYLSKTERDLPKYLSREISSPSALDAN